ncbi:MAG: IclR family transcriptional regulator [Streptosporangiales bacterium]
MQPVVRALAVLKTLAPSATGKTMAELSECLDVPQGSMHRVLAVLEREQFITRSPTNRRYFLGPAARQLAEVNAQQNGLLLSPHPALRAAAEECDETVFLTELVGDRAICVSLVESTHPLRMFVRIGQDMPLHAAASARTLLAHMDESAARRLLESRPLTHYTDSTPATVEEVLEHLVVVRARGYDVCDDELDHGVWAVSTPVRASTGRVVASVSMAVPSHRVEDIAERERLRGVVLRAAARLAGDLGWAGDDDAAALEPEVSRT